MKQYLGAAVFVCAMLAGPAFGQYSTQEATGVAGPALTDISAAHGTIWQIKRAGMITQGFFSVHNDGKRTDTLTGWSCPLAKETNLVGADGKTIKSLDIPPGKSIELSAKGPHLVLLSPRDSIDRGSIVPCGLTFANQGDVGVMLYAVPQPK